MERGTLSSAVFVSRQFFGYYQLVSKYGKNGWLEHGRRDERAQCKRKCHSRHSISSLLYYSIISYFTSKRYSIFIGFSLFDILPIIDSLRRCWSFDKQRGSLLFITMYKLDLDSSVRNRLTRLSVLLHAGVLLLSVSRSSIFA